MDDLLDKCIAIAKQAGAEIMKIYQSGEFETEIKIEGNFISPLTKADKLSNEIITSELKRIATYPVLSEEGTHEIGNSQSFWLVDPIDGTKEFIDKNGEFTVNIGLIENKKPVLGVIYAPAFDLMYYGLENKGSFKVTKNKKQPIKAVYSNKIPTIAVSRSHVNEQTQAFLDELKEHKLIRTGSSLKLCYVAEGKASIYPRLGQTHLWDNAAGDAIVRAAGGSVHTLEGTALEYDPKNLESPFFIARTKD